MYRLARLVLWIAPGVVFAAPPQTFVNRYCVGCHNAKLKTAGLALDSGTSRAAWEKVARRLRARQMPPVGLPRPDEAAYASAVAELEATLDAAPVDPGRTHTFRRLNRSEYHNAVRDLLAVDVDVTALLPGDEPSHGFDNVSAGELSPMLLERYLGAARKISRLAVGIPAKRPGGDTVTLPPDLTQEEHFDGLPLGTRGGTAVRYTFPADAEYEIQVRLARDRNEHVEGLYTTHEMEVLVDGERVQVFTVKPPPSGSDHHAVDQHLNVRVPVKAGPHVVMATFPKRPSALLETERQPYQAHFNMDRHPRVQTAVYSVSINGPYNPQGAGQSPSRARLFVCDPARGQEDACAKRILNAAMRRAYRRPVGDADLRAPMKFFAEARKDGNFDTGIEMALRAILVSPEFLFRVEEQPARTAPGAAYRVRDLELASRLSFFLWSSIPDDELLELAIQGSLQKPGVLEKQVRRMLADPRSHTLVTNFAGQWLQLRKLASTTPDMRAFPDFDDNLRQAFLRETELFFESIQREDRSVLDLLRANYTFVNERLAKHYGIPNIYGSRFRKVTFDGGGARGGLLRQGSVLTVTSYATRTSPVIRGKWVLDNLLGVPPPPPPAVVPPLAENRIGVKPRSVRERLAQHRGNPACSGCHQLMDPVGFALENYDAVGRWRSTDDSLPIDAAGSLPDGSRFDGVAGLQRTLLNRPDVFVTTLCEKLVTYALGREVEYFDGPAIRKIVKEAQADDFRFSSLVVGIARSVPFQMRRAQ